MHVQVGKALTFGSGQAECRRLLRVARWHADAQRRKDVDGRLVATSLRCQLQLQLDL